jgi:hypothetical protein
VTLKATLTTLAFALHADLELLAEPRRGRSRRAHAERLHRGSVCSVEHPTDATTLWAEHRNDSPKPFIWRTEADTIIAKTRPGRDTLAHNTNSTSDH